VAQPKESGKVHNNIKALYQQGDETVVKAMQQFAQFASEAREALENGDSQRLASLMDANFDLRRSLYGDAVIGEKNLRMIQLAREHGNAAKFCGSGGCIVGLWAGDPCDPNRDEQMRALKQALRKDGFVFGTVSIQPTFC
jgi:glucuronokinase